MNLLYNGKRERRPRKRIAFSFDLIKIRFDFSLGYVCFNFAWYPEKGSDYPSKKEISMIRKGIFSSKKVITYEYKAIGNVLTILHEKCARKSIFSPNATLVCTTSIIPLTRQIFPKSRLTCVSHISTTVAFRNCWKQWRISWYMVAQMSFVVEIVFYRTRPYLEDKMHTLRNK